MPRGLVGRMHSCRPQRPELQHQFCEFSTFSLFLFTKISSCCEWRSLRFEEEIIDKPDYQGNAVINYTEYEIPYTRIAEHKYFDPSQKSPKTVITKEYSKTWSLGDEAYYPINNQRNSELYAKYKELADKLPNIHFGGRLGTYSYYNMDVVVEKALQLVEQLLRK